MLPPPGAPPRPENDDLIPDSVPQTVPRDVLRRSEPGGTTLKLAWRTLYWENTSGTRNHG